MTVYLSFFVGAFVGWVTGFTVAMLAVLVIMGRKP